MKLFSVAMTLVLTVSLVGCGRGTPGGPGATKKVETTTDPNTGETKSKVSTTAVDSDATFKLKPPITSVNVKRGEKIETSMGISRGSKFDQDVALHFDNMPKGVSIEPASPQLRKGTDEAKFFIAAAKDAEPGSYTVKSSGRPGTGRRRRNP